MSRRPSSFLMALLLSLCPAFAADKNIVILRSGALPIYDFAVQGFTERLTSRNVAFTLKDFVMPKSAGELDGTLEAIRGAAPDLVLTIGTSAARVMRDRGGGIPYVFAMIVDPPSIALASSGAVMEVKPSEQIDFIRGNFPGLRRVGVVYSDGHNRETIRFFREEKSADISMIVVLANTPEEMSNAIQRLAREADCLLMTADATLYSSQTATQVILQTIQNDLPIIAVSPTFVKAGALAGIYPDYKDNGQMAADVAARFFAGEKLESIPVQWASKTKTAVNLIVAKRMGLAVPRKTIDAAEQVVQ